MIFFYSRYSRMGQYIPLYSFQYRKIINSIDGSFSFRHVTNYRDKSVMVHVYGYLVSDEEQASSIMIIS